jgi:hypothetical protein
MMGMVVGFSIPSFVIPLFLCFRWRSIVRMVQGFRGTSVKFFLPHAMAISAVEGIRIYVYMYDI